MPSTALVPGLTEPKTNTIVFFVVSWGRETLIKKYHRTTECRREKGEGCGSTYRGLSPRIGGVNVSFKQWCLRLEQKNEESAK